MRRIGHCLNEQLQSIYNQNRQLASLTTTVHHFIPKELKSCCQVVNFTQGTLVLKVSDAAWATQLRYYLPELRDALRREAGLYQLAAIKLTLDEESKQTAIKIKKRALLSAKARNAIKASGDECAYLPLKEALYKLAGE